MNYNIILRFLEYEKKENYQRLYILSLSTLLYEIGKILPIYRNLKEIQSFII